MSTEDPSTIDSSFETIYVPGDVHDTKIEDTLLKKKLVTQEQLDRARVRFRDGDHSTLLQVILEQTAGMSTRIELLKAVAEHMGRPFRRVTTEDISADVFSQLPVRYMHSHKVVPIQWTPEGTVEVATCAPTDQFALDELHYHFSVPFEIVVATPEDIESILSEMTADFSDDSMSIEDAFNELEFDDDTGGARGQIDLEDITGDSPVVRYVSLMIASALTGVLAQRLVRRICTYCKTEVEPSSIELGHMERMGYKGDIRLFRGTGCSHCRQMGYRGRVGVFELLHMNDEFREEFAGQVSASRLREVAVRLGMRTLREDGFMKVNQGLTTIEEITRVL
jgi:type II secretory ATPase GspE/PulE/Tfp pilus assembly ATPase PilB-like protein